MSLTLRPYQLGAIDKLRRHLAAGRRQALLVAPTGAGKTAIAGEMIQSAVSLGSRVLCLAHREELILQLLNRIIDLGIYPGAIQADHYKYQPHLPVQVASVQTLSRRPEMPPANLIIIDEAHRAKADTYGFILKKYPGVAVVGLTASPWRTDGRGLADLFQACVVAARPRELIEQGFLVPFTGFAYDAPDLSGVRQKGSDYEEAGLELVMSSSTLVGNVVERYQAHVAGRRAVVFAATIRHSQQLTERFRAAGAPTEHVDGTTPHAQRQAILLRLRTGQTKVVCNVGILTEGFDLPQLEVCILARPTLSTGLFLQMVGRVLRPACMSCGKYAHPTAASCSGCGSLDIKRRALIHDHAACVLAHGQPDQDRDYSLTASRKSAKQSAAEPLRTCRYCLAIFVAGPAACPACGKTAPVEPRRVLREVEGVEVPLEEVQQRPRVSQEVALPVIAELIKTQEAKGYKPQWVGMRCRMKLGFWPSRAQLEKARRLG